LTFVGASSETDQRFLDELVASRPKSEYAAAMLERRGVTGAAAALRANVTSTPAVHTAGAEPVRMPELAPEAMPEALPDADSEAETLVGGEALTADAVTHRLDRGRPPPLPPRPLPPPLPAARRVLVRRSAR
jgi:hypothetical protein